MFVLNIGREFATHTHTHTGWLGILNMGKRKGIKNERAIPTHNKSPPD